MKLREITRPQINEFSMGQAANAAKAYWNKAWPKLAPFVKTAAYAALVLQVIEAVDDMEDIDCDHLPTNECAAAKTAIWAKLIAQFGVDYVMFAVGAVALGFTGPIGAGAGGIISMLVSHWMFGENVDQAADKIVMFITNMGPGTMLARPVKGKKAPEAPINDAAAKYAQKQAIKMGLPDTSPTAERVLKMAKWYRAHPEEIKP